jgi:hypothetical protein
MLLRYHVRIFSLLIVAGALIGFGVGASVLDALIAGSAVSAIIVYGTLGVAYTLAKVFNKEELLKELE